MSTVKRQKVMTQPIVSNTSRQYLESYVKHQIFRLLQTKSRVQLMLYENTTLRMEGVIIGFDEYMNLVLDDASEVDMKQKTRKKLGRIMMKGENITAIFNAPQV